MPFEEVKVTPTRWVRVASKSDGAPLLVISKEIREKHFKNPNDKARIFVDTENSILGIQPALEGHRICRYGRVYVGNRLASYRICEKTYRVKWDVNQEMVIAKIEFEKDE